MAETFCRFQVFNVVIFRWELVRRSHHQDRPTSAQIHRPPRAQLWMTIHLLDFLMSAWMCMSSWTKHMVLFLKMQLSFTTEFLANRSGFSCLVSFCRLAILQFQWIRPHFLINLLGYALANENFKLNFLRPEILCPIFLRGVLTRAMNY